jgi:hypothetical protein
MRKRIAIVLLLCVLLAVSVAPVLAGGDKVRGDEGWGCVHQKFDTSNPPFDPGSSGDLRCAAQTPPD